MCRRMEDSNTSPEMSSRILHRLGLIALVAVGFTLGLMGVGIVGALVAVSTVFIVDQWRSASDADGPVTTSKLRNG